MFMTASRIIIQDKPVLKLNIHEYDESAVPFLNELGIDKMDDDIENCRYRLIYSREDFLDIRSRIFEKYDVEEKGPRAYLEPRS